MTENFFYVVLPSNVKNGYTNKANNFRIRLPNQIDLSGGNWEVGLSELIYPLSHYNIGNGANMDRCIVFQVLDSVVYVLIEKGFYKTIDIFVQKLNEQCKNALPEGSAAKFSFDRTSYKTRLTLPQAIDLKFMGRELSYCLGFPFRTASIQFDESRTAVSTYAADISAALQEMYIYSDIVAPQIVGQGQANLLKLISLASIKGERQFGDKVHVKFTKPQFLKLRTHIFQEILTEIKTGSGTEFPFKFGTVILTLCFRRASLRL